MFVCFLVVNSASLISPTVSAMMPFFKNYCNSKPCFNIRRTGFSIINFRDGTWVVQHVYSSRGTTLPSLWGKYVAIMFGITLNLQSYVEKIDFFFILSLFRNKLYCFINWNPFYLAQESLNICPISYWIYS